MTESYLVLYRRFYLPFWPIDYIVIPAKSTVIAMSKFTSLFPRHKIWSVFRVTDLERVA